MASTYAELFSDFQDTVKLYVEKLDVTEKGFMRLISRGLQLFQRETEYIEKNLRITPNADGSYTIPDDFMRYIEIRAIPSSTTDADLQSVINSNSSSLVTLYDPKQYFNARNDFEDNYKKIPYPNIVHRRTDKTVYMGTIFENKILIHPGYNQDLYLRYIPNIPSFARTGIWITPDTTTGIPPVTTYNSWFPVNQMLNINGQPITRFMYMFTTAQLPLLVNQYEQAILDYAIGRYIKAKGNSNYVVYINDFNSEVQSAKINKPTMFKQGHTYYMYAPFS